MKLVRLGERALRFPRPDVNGRALERALRARGAVDVVLAEDDVLAVYNIDAVPGPEVLEEAIAEASAGVHHASIARSFAIAIRYDGPDLAEIEATLGLARPAIVSMHSGATFEVKMIGFLPGFAYLGDLPPGLAVPRRKAPRARVPAMSVAIAGPYTAVYPFASPGGWNLIGTALPFDPFEISTGDRVRFVVAE